MSLHDMYAWREEHIILGMLQIVRYVLAIPKISESVSSLYVRDDLDMMASLQ